MPPRRPRIGYHRMIGWHPVIGCHSERSEESLLSAHNKASRPYRRLTDPQRSRTGVLLSYVRAASTARIRRSYGYARLLIVKSSPQKLSRRRLAAAAIALAAVSFTSPRLAVAQAPAPASAQAAAQEKQAARPPKLVVVIVVDQMRADYVQRFRGEWHGGLARLVNQGAWFQNAAYPYSGTETCPGHATIGTGDYPHTTGIIGNTWWDRAAAQPVTCTQDSAERDVGAGQIAVSDSPSHLLVPTFAERLRAARPGSRVVTISLKARAAIMLAGHHADAVLWQDEFTGDWFTSSAYSQSLPAFANDFLAANPFSAGTYQKYGSRACRTANTTTALPRRERVHLQDGRPFFLTPFRRTRPSKIRRRRIEPPTAHPWDAGAPARLAMNIWSGSRKPPSTTT